MVNELKQAVDKAEKLSINDQQAIARLILDEIEWFQTFRDSQNNLVTLAEEAISEFRTGKTKPLDLSEWLPVLLIDLGNRLANYLTS